MCLAGERRGKRGKDARALNSSAIQGSEDTAPRRPAAARRAQGIFEGPSQTRSTIIALPWPPATHIVSIPTC